MEGRRNRSLVLALLAAVVGRGSGIVSALIVLPLMLGSLSDAAFADFATIAIILRWTSTLNIALGPGAPMLIAANSSSPAIVRRVSWSTLQWAAVVAGVLALGVVLLGRLWFDVGLDTAAAIAVVGATVVGAACAEAVEGIRLGLLRDARSSLWAALGTAVGTALVIWIASGEPQVWHFVMAVFLVPSAIRSLGVLDLQPAIRGWSWKERPPAPQRHRTDNVEPTAEPHGRPAPSARGIRAGGLQSTRRLRFDLVDLARANVFHIATQVGIMLGFPLGVLLFRAYGTDAQVAQIFVAQAIGTAGASLLQTAIRPLAPAVTDAIALGELRWIASVARAIAIVLAVVGVVWLLLAVTVGEPLVRRLYGEAGPDRIVLVLLVVYAVAGTAGALLYQIVIGAQRFATAAAAALTGSLVAAAFVATGASTGSVLLAVVGVAVAERTVAIGLLYRPAAATWKGAG